MNPKVAITVCCSPVELSERLKRPRFDLLAVVLLVADHRDLSDLLALCDLLWDARVVVILPNQENETLIKGHRLRPRFLAYVDGKAGDVSQVLTKMNSTSVRACHTPWMS
ncbi:MAG TPA: hypothetical protein DEO88_11495 [Syntrophobacteraceae bacterium]|nr:hypothetical protein [Syntrophobacteraceae bacterium]